MAGQVSEPDAAHAPVSVNSADPQEWVTVGVRQYAELLGSADPLAIAVQLMLWLANHRQVLDNTRAIDALDLPVSITGSRLAIMRTLYCTPEKRMALSKLSKAAGISPTMATNLVGALAKTGLVRRVGSESDRRVSFAELTPEGEETFLRVLPVMSERMTASCATFSQEEKELLLSLLQRLC
ncbi:MAG TPA: MarR family transcriptional regulator [Dehalococcoidia bacterium]|nr:MarR family transcriptional regulator [Dehalococcoidia bacterium]